MDVTGNTFEVKEGISCEKKKFPAIGRNLLSQEGFVLAKAIFHFKRCSFPVNGRKFLLQQGDFLSRSDVCLVMLQMRHQTREFPKIFRVSPQYFVGDYIPISPGISLPDRY